MSRLYPQDTAAANIFPRRCRALGINTVWAASTASQPAFQPSTKTALQRQANPGATVPGLPGIRRPARSRSEKRAQVERAVRGGSSAEPKAEQQAGARRTLEVASSRARRAQSPVLHLALFVHTVWVDTALFCCWLFSRSRFLRVAND